MLSSGNVSGVLDSPVSATEAEINLLEQQNVREESYHLHRLATALQVTGIALISCLPKAENASIIASVEGLIWKIWVLQEEEFETGGIYLFANRQTAEAYLSHPVIQAVRSHPAVVSTESKLWDVESSLSALTRGPLRDVSAQSSEPTVLLAGGQ